MTEEDMIEAITTINVELARILCTQDMNVVRSWWHRQNTKFDPTPFEFIRDNPEELLYMVEYFKGVHSR